MFGILNCNKPSGVTSRRVVDWVKRQIKPVRVGHAGTLDPLADGVLVLALGAARRLIPYIQQQAKIYEATFQLGVTNESLDSEMPLVPLRDSSVPSLAALHDAALALTGSIEQVPPIYSAIKIGGQPAYKKARRGQQVAIPPRRVQIDAIEILAYDYPNLRCRITCGSGTYIRTLGSDLARRVGSDAVMTRLTRAAIGAFSIDEAIGIDREITRCEIEQSLLPLRPAAACLPQVTLDREQLEEIVHGRRIELPGPRASEVAALDEAGALRAILEPRGEQYKPKRVFPVPADSC